MQQDIFNTLNKLTMDNYEDFIPDLVQYLSDYNQSKYMSECIINKTLSEKLYINLYCNLIKFLSEKKVQIQNEGKTTNFQ